MPAVTPDFPQGATIVIGGSAFTALIQSSRLTGFSRAFARTTTWATANAHTKKPARLYDSGQLEVTIQHDTDLAPPIVSTTEATVITITYPDLIVWSCNGFVTSYTADFSDGEQLMTGTVILELTGRWTINTTPL